MKIHLTKNFIINVIVTIILLILPYFIFEFKYYIGGDDTRLFYLYPEEWIKNIAFFSWFHFSSVGLNSPNQSILPFLFVWWGIHNIITSKLILSYLAFSLPLILGYFYFQKLCAVLFTNTDKHKMEIIIGGFIYIFSPILLYNQLSIFLYSIWLIALLPIISYYFISYLKYYDFKYVIYCMLWCILFSIAMSSVPWILGFILPFVISLVCCSVLFNKQQITIFIKRTLLFIFFIVLSQSFWLLPFSLNYLIKESNSIGNLILSKQVADTFTPTVLSTATGNLIFPLLNLFHRQIAFDYNWDLKNVYILFYDRTLLLNGIYLIILFFGIFNFSKLKLVYEKKVYLILLVAFLVSLFFFTVNIYPFKNFFLLMGHIPGFVMFRSFYDKFALGYVLLFSLITTYSLIILKLHIKTYYKYIVTVLIVVIICGVLPIKLLMNRPLWLTNNIYTNIVIPQEYKDFMNAIKSKISTDNNILSLPFNIAGYTIIKDQDSNNIFAGRSPVQLFTGINDYSGDLSFPTEVTSNFIELLKKRDYERLNNLLYTYNINYVFITHNIPPQVQKSYLFNPDVLKVQDEKLYNNLLGEKVISSKNGNYSLYMTKKPSLILESKNITYEKINEVKYLIHIKNLKGKQELIFKDAYNSNWKLFLSQNNNDTWCESPQYIKGTVRCKQEKKYFETEDITLITKKSIFSNSHTIENDFSNKWLLDADYIKKNYNSNYYKVNSDDTINTSFILYFVPQLYFYSGAFITLITIAGCGIYLIAKKRRKYEK